MQEQKLIEIRPQPGPQEMFLSSHADIVIYGGAAGGGKTFGLLLDSLRDNDNSAANCVIFRRTTKDIRKAGGLLDNTYDLYPLFDAKLNDNLLTWSFPSGYVVQLAHMEHEKNRLDWQGAQIAKIFFEELTHFTEKQFWYLFSRNRSTCGIAPYVRATCNPESDHWVGRLLDWWIDADGFAIQERSGIIRYFIRQHDEIIWRDTAEELIEEFGADEDPISFTFIAAKLEDNPILMQKDPDYLKKLRAMDAVTRAQLLGGNWKIKAQSGDYFKRSWCEVIDVAPEDKLICARGWDKAATRASPSNPDPDYTVGTKISRLRDGRFCVEHVERLRDGPMGVKNAIKNTATQDGKNVKVILVQDPGAAGKADVQADVSALAGYDVKVVSESGNKLTRFKAFSAQAEARNILVVRGEWNESWFNELEGFTGDNTGHDDQVDSASTTFNAIAETNTPRIRAF